MHHVVACDTVFFNLLLFHFQMHGYDLGNMHQPPPPLHPPMMQDALVHPDSADSYVTYLESDDSMPASP